MVVYAKFNSTRNTAYALCTTAKIDQSGQYYFSKEAQNPTAVPFLLSIHKNYLSLQQETLPFTLVPCTLTLENTLLFPQQAGTSLHALLTETCIRKDSIQFFDHFDIYCEKVRSLIQETPTVPSKEFQSYFGKSELSYDHITLGFFDLIFENILLQDRQFHLIDYEWIFPFAIPYKYVVFRALVHFYSNIKAQGILPPILLSSLLERVGIGSDEKEECIRFDHTILRHINNSSYQPEDFPLFRTRYIQLEEWGSTPTFSSPTVFHTLTSLEDALAQERSKNEAASQLLLSTEAHVAKLESNLQTLYEEHAITTMALEEERKNTSTLSTELVYHQNHALALQHSLSWKITYPLRVFHTLITTVLQKTIQCIRDMPHAFHLLKREGLRSFIKRLFLYIQGHRLLPPPPLLLDHYACYQQQEQAHQESPSKILETISTFSSLPCFSIITPVYNVNPHWLDACILSVQQQSYPHWELCLYDDASTHSDTLACLHKWENSGDSRIKIIYGASNLHIARASNEAIRHATGDFICLLDNDDTLAPHALYELAKTIHQYPDADYIYTDEDKIDEENNRSQPFFKPDWNPYLLRSVNYCCHLSCIRKTLGDQVGWFRAGFEGSQDYDLILRVTEKTKSIYHIPKILYHWRMHETSTAKDVGTKSYAHEAGVRALEEHLQRMHINGHVVQGIGRTNYHVIYHTPSVPLVSIIIPFKDKPELLKQCVESIVDKTLYTHYEILLISNNSTAPETHTLLAEYALHPKISVYEHNVPFNFSAINNWAVEKTQGEYIIFLNNDTKVISPEWIDEMLGVGMQSEVGAVGAQLLFPDETIQHAGVILGLTGLAGHVFAKQYPHDTYFHLAEFSSNYLAVTAACLLVKKEKFLQVGGFDERFTVCGNDVDLCLKLYEQGYVNVYNPYAKLYHFESKTRDPYNIPECDFAISRERYAPYLNHQDPYFNKNFSLTQESLTY